MRRILVVGGRDEGRNENYYRAVEAAGGEPVPCDASDAEGSVAGCCGVLLPGGADVNPGRYGERNTASRDIDDALDAVELRVIRAAVDGGKPVLGICRGLQILNVFFGGTLIQDVERRDVHERDGGADRVHPVRSERGSFLHRLYGTQDITVNSAHHQAIRVPGRGLVPVQHSADGIIEAVEHERLPVLAVQWHPERMCLANARGDTADGLPVFLHFAALCGIPREHT